MSKYKFSKFQIQNFASICIMILFIHIFSSSVRSFINSQKRGKDQDFLSLSSILSGTTMRMAFREYNGMVDNTKCSKTEITVNS